MNTCPLDFYHQSDNPKKKLQVSLNFDWRSRPLSLNGRERQTKFSEFCNFFFDCHSDQPPPRTEMCCFHSFTLNSPQARRYFSENMQNRQKCANLQKCAYNWVFCLGRQAICQKNGNTQICPHKFVDRSTSLLMGKSACFKNCGSQCGL